MSDDMSAVAAQPQAKTNTLVIVSLVFAFLAPLVGAILGHVALSQITRRGEQGRGLALAGIIVGWVLTGSQSHERTQLERPRKDASRAAVAQFLAPLVPSESEVKPITLNPWD